VKLSATVWDQISKQIKDYCIIEKTIEEFNPDINLTPTM
jgi:hypothetical protein